MDVGKLDRTLSGDWYLIKSSFAPLPHLLWSQIASCLDSMASTVEIPTLLADGSLISMGFSKTQL